MTERPVEAPPRFALLARAIPVLVGLLLALVLILLTRRPFRAFDTYFHLRFGEEFRHGWSIAHPGQLSSASTNDWVPTQWLGQVGLSWVDDIAGAAGLAVLLGAVAVALTGSLYLVLRHRAGPALAAALTAVAVIGWLPSLSLRPQLLSYLFLVAVVAAWDRARRTGSAPWLLVPLAWLWATCHGMWVLGVGASAVLAVAVVLERRPFRRASLPLLAVPVAMLLAALVTPVGPRLLSAVLLVNSRAEYFHEWRAPELITVAALPVTGLLVAAVLLLVRRDGVRPYDIGLLGLGGVFAVYSQRTLPLALIVLTCVVAGAARRTAPRISWPESAGLAALAALVLAVAPTQSVLDDPAEDVRPFTTALDALPPGSVVVTDWPIGSILLWTEPQLEIPLHGYGDVYTDAELERYDDLARLAPGWDATLARLAPDAALLPFDDPLAYALAGRGWSWVQTGGAGPLVLLTPPR
ncbi:hypothetical protein KVF89_03995 [Nocardioides carbamazepini]|uniref:hypothetical protein n=1 Tax=Nocardioides carbamazepini TaxID=2854259 RepID=UPI00214A1023|nr:hypothetical protein [Nocardioides carbamazepini]MCR1781687.1 hypothetical protein [Nocardioides carbamazepini]